MNDNGIGAKFKFRYLGYNLKLLKTLLGYKLGRPYLNIKLSGFKLSSLFQFQKYFVFYCEKFWICNLLI